MQTSVNENRRSLGELLVDLSSQLTTLVRKEFQLAKVEMTQKVSSMSKDVVLMAVGCTLLYTGVLVLVATAVFGLATWLSLWLSALLIAIVVLCFGSILYLVGRKSLREKNVKPTQTIISLKENKEWIKRRI